MNALARLTRRIGSLPVGLCVSVILLGMGCRDGIAINIPGEPLPADTRVALSDASWSHVFLTSDSAYAVVGVRGLHESNATAGIPVILTVKSPDGSVLTLSSVNEAGTTSLGSSAFFAWPVKSPGDYAASASSPRSEDDLNFVIHVLDREGFIFYDLQPNSRVSRGWIALSADRHFVSAYTGGSREAPSSRTWGGSGSYTELGDRIMLQYPLEARLVFNFAQLYGGGLSHTERSIFFQDARLTPEQLVVRWNDPNNDSCCIDWRHIRRDAAHD